MITAEKSDTISVGPDNPQFRFIDGTRLVPRAEVRIFTDALVEKERRLLARWVKLGFIQAYANMTSEEYVLASLRNGQ
jgi:precorrin-4 methylase